MNEVRLIDAEKLKETIISICGNCSNIIREYKEGVPDGNCAIQHIMNMIDNAPTITDYSKEIAQKSIELGCRVGRLEEKIEHKRPQGEWKSMQGSSVVFDCSCCNARIIALIPYNFCPNCGADMRGEENE